MLIIIDVYCIRAITLCFFFFFFSSRRRHTRCSRDWSSDVCSSDLFFGALAMFLGTIGIYGVMAHLVSQRIHEIGIRMALGASPVQVLRMVIGSGLKLAVVGVAVGIVVALAATRSLTTLLYQVAPNDPLTFTAVPILFVAVAVAACYLPACRAMGVDPIVALRYE